jgi:trans-2,3-dihydro-3-hydroxyanthranilate isomerase
MPLTYHVLDVFTNQRLAGNPLAVVLEADELETSQMQAIAREFNLPETVFLLKPLNPAHSARVRIFTPMSEVPFAGHPTIGTAVLMGELRLAGMPGNHDQLVTLEQTVGLVRVGVRMRMGHATYAEFDAPKLPVADGALASVEQIGAALGLMASEIGFANHRPARFSAGTSFAFVPVATREALARAQVRHPAWHAAFGAQGLVGAYLYCRETVHNAADFHARMFAPDVGIPEDPATGSAAVMFAGVILSFDTLPDGTHKRRIEQGYHMGRPSEVSLSLEVKGGKLHNVRIGGPAVRVAEGQLHL